MAAKCGYREETALNERVAEERLLWILMKVKVGLT